MSPYPPGTSRRDLVRGGIIEPHAHDHEFLLEDTGVVFEDSAVIFTQRCHYAEGEYGQGWECEEEVSMRVDADRLIRHREGQPDVSYTFDALDTRCEPYNHQLEMLEYVMMAIETGKGTVLDVDPPKGKYGDGSARVAYEDYEVVYGS